MVGSSSSSNGHFWGRSYWAGHKKDVNLPELFAVTTGADPKPVYRPPWLGGRLLKIKIQTKCNQIKSSVSL